MNYRKRKASVPVGLNTVTCYLGSKAGGEIKYNHVQNMVGPWGLILQEEV